MMKFLRLSKVVALGIILSVVMFSCKEKKQKEITEIKKEASKIIFQSDRDGNSEIYVMNIDGTEQTRLTNNPAEDGAAAWSPKGDKIVFESNRDGNLEIYLMNIDGTNIQRLTNNTGTDTAPRWTPDGKNIMFGSTRGNRRGAFVMNADGSNVRMIPTADFIGGSPSSSPDGKRAVVEHENGPEWTEETEYLRRAQIWAISINESIAPVQLTNVDAYNGYPAWSPNGEKIIFDSNPTPGNPPANIMCINADGTGLKNLTNSIGYNEFGAWSHDNNKIVFVTDRDGNNEIYSMNADGTQQTRLTNNNVDDTIASWFPVLNQ